MRNQIYQNEFQSLKQVLNFHRLLIMTFIVISVHFNIFLHAQICPNYLFTIVDTTRNPLTKGGQEVFDNLDDFFPIESAEVITFNNLGSILSGPTLTTYLQLGSNSRCLTVENHSLQSSGYGDYYWAGANDSGESIQLFKDSTGYGGYITIIEDIKRMYSFVALSPTETALVKFDSTYMFDPTWMACGDSIDVEEDTIGNYISLVNPGNAPRNSLCLTTNIRVLFLFTEVIEGVIPLLQNNANRIIAELNNSTMSSGLDQADIRFQSAGLILLPGFTEGLQSIRQDVNELSNNNDAQDLRDETFADLVILITDNVYTETAGKAKGISVSNGNAYAIAVIGAALNNFTATHEIGHLIGARHQKCSTCLNDDCDIFTCHHGFPVGENFRTIMYPFIDQGDQNECGERTREGIWSSEDTPFRGDPTGNNQNQNARKLRLRAERVACFRETPPPGPITDPLPIGIYGPSSISGCYTPHQDVSQWAATTTQTLVSPVSYIWDFSYNGVNGWVTLSTNSSFLINNNLLPDTWFVLRLRVTDGSPGFASVSKEIDFIPCSPPPQNHEDSINTNILSSIEDDNLEPNKIYKLFPNPSNDYIIITSKNDQTLNKVEVFDALGNPVETIINIEEKNRITINMELIPPGLYIVFITSNDGVSLPFKILKL